MNVYLNRIDGIDDAIVSMFLSKRTLTRDLELEVRNEVCRYSTVKPDVNFPRGSLCIMTERLEDWLIKLFKWGVRHCTMLSFIDLSFTVYGLHRGGQDDLDSHAKRMDNRIIRASTRLADFSQGELSDYYKGKIIPTDTALSVLNIHTPDEIEVDGSIYVRTANGYILKGMEDNRDVKRGLYMLSIPSNFIFRCNLRAFAHIYQERNQNSTAHPELKDAVERMAEQIQTATGGYVTPELLLKIKD